MRIFRAEWISLWIKIQFNSLGINRTDCIAHEKIFEKAYSYIWRLMNEYFLFERWKLAVGALQQGADLYGKTT